MSLSMPNASRTDTSRSGAAIAVPPSPWVLVISFIASGCLDAVTLPCNKQGEELGEVVMKVYGFPLSPFVRKVLVVAEEKGVETQVVPTNPMAPDDEFVDCSPYRKIPAIDDNGFKLADSSAIATYLEAKHPEPALLPADPQARAKAVWFDEVADTIVMAAGG